MPLRMYKCMYIIDRHVRISACGRLPAQLPILPKLTRSSASSGTMVRGWTAGGAPGRGVQRGSFYPHRVSFFFFFSPFFRFYFYFYFSWPLYSRFSPRPAPRCLSSHGFIKDPSRPPPCSPRRPLLPAAPWRSLSGLQGGCVAVGRGAPANSPEHFEGEGALGGRSRKPGPCCLCVRCPPYLQVCPREQPGIRQSSPRPSGTGPPPLLLRSRPPEPSGFGVAALTTGDAKGEEMYRKGAEGKEVPAQHIVVYIHFIGKKKNLYIKIFWQTVKSIHKCKYILLLKQ